jgi:hypothetical protein
MFFGNECPLKTQFSFQMWSTPPKSNRKVPRFTYTKKEEERPTHER